VAADIATQARRIARDMGGDQVATSGVIELEPNLVNVIARRAKVTVDLRNTDEDKLRQAERRMTDHVAALARDEGVEITAKTLARFEPVEFDGAMVTRIAHAVRRRP
jgi:N-carbamoyl-L-amino-acid hydrolase